MVWLIGYEVTVHEILRVEIQLSIAFYEKAKWDLSDACKYSVQTVTDFLLVSAENTKNELFRHFKDHNLQEYTWELDKWPHSFHLLLELYLLVYFIFAFQDLQNSAPWGPPPPLHNALVCKICIYMPKMILSSLLTYISFSYIKFANFWYITCFVPNLIPIWPWSHGL